MKVNIKKLNKLLLGLFIFVSVITGTALADAGSGGISISDSIVIINPFQPIYYDWEYEPNFRTMQILDVATFINEHSAPESNADYRPDMNLDIENLYFLQLADIEERWFFNEKPEDIKREPVTTVDGEGEYSYKLKILIDKNILSRDNTYIMTREASMISKDNALYTNLDKTSEKWKDKAIKDSTILNYNDESNVQMNKVEKNE